MISHSTIIDFKAFMAIYLILPYLSGSPVARFARMVAVHRLRLLTSAESVTLAYSVVETKKFEPDELWTTIVFPEHCHSPSADPRTDQPAGAQSATFDWEEVAEPPGGICVRDGFARASARLMSCSSPCSHVGDNPSLVATSSRPRQENRSPAFRNGALSAINGVQERTQGSHDTDAQAALNEARYARALKALSPSDVLAAVDDLVAQMLDARHHPVDELEAHGPRYGCGKRPQMSEMVRASYEPVIDEAITR